MSTGPSWATPSSKAAQGGHVADVGLPGEDAPVQRLDRPHRLGELLRGAHLVAHRLQLGADVDRDDVGALLRQPDRVAPTLAAGGSGDEGDLALELSHVTPRVAARDLGGETVAAVSGRCPVGQR